MSGSCGSDFFYHPGNDSDDEGIVASSHASEMSDTVGSRKRTRPPTQIVSKTWVFCGLIIADAALLHAQSDDNEEGPFPRLKSLLLAHCTRVYPHFEDRIEKLILYLAFFYKPLGMFA